MYAENIEMTAIFDLFGVTIYVLNDMLPTTNLVMELLDAREGLEKSLTPQLLWKTSVLS